MIGAMDAAPTSHDRADPTPDLSASWMQLEGPGDTSALVELVGVHKSFGAQRVLKGVSVSFPARRTTVVLGPSGSGKSVILKHIAGLHPLLANCLRLTVGTPDENTLMIDALKASL